MYQPPEDCRKIPHDAVNEWSLNASQTSLLPHLSYGKEPVYQDRQVWYCPDCNSKMGGNARRCTNCGVFDPQRMDRNITAESTDSQIMTFSIVYREQDCVQCYIYWMGSMHRLIPEQQEETKNVLRDIFKMDSKRYPMNQHFLESDACNKILQELASKIKDPRFMYFRKLCHSQ